ncbi:MAG: oligosaccharide flippase family protein [Eubacterium sp.]
MKINQLKIGVILSYISMGISTVISILYTPIMLRLLGQSEYGLYQLVFSVVSYLGLLSFGFGSAYMRFFARYKVKNDQEGIARLNGMFMLVFLLIAVVALLAGSLLILNIETLFKNSLTGHEIATAKILMTLMVFNIAVSFPASVFDANVTAHEQYFFQRIVNLLRSVLNPFLTLPLLLMGYKSISLVVVTTLLTLGSLLVNVWFCFKKLKIRFSFKHFEIDLFKEIAVFSSFVFLNMITDQINWSVDKFILGVLAGTAGVAVYSIAAQLNTYYLNFSTSISSVFIPRINCIVAENSDNKQLTEIFTKVGRIQFVILSLIISGYIVLGQAFIYFWAGSDYTSSYFVGLWLMIPVTVPLIQNLGIEIQRAKNMHKFRSIVYIFIAIGNILLSIPLCKLYGPVGCAVGTAISLLIGNGLIMNWYYQKKIGLDIKYFWYEIAKFIPSLIIPGIMCVIILLFVKIQTISALLLWGIAYVIIFILSIWKFGLNAYERNLFSSPIKKLANHFKRG